ncbi:hypothetical protein H5410_051924 [Solanum commersonii]|uniref:SCP domain-containing protein n=1 Tax=Solanum commersonii TaxID=4109 RepID=A0A9J5WZF6_SOLCO|nr:hypothetical protein H5410_051924 [Solanum commersonii]
MPSFFHLASALVFILIVSHFCHAQQDYLDAHNTARASVGVEPLTWDDQVVAYAQQYASQLATDCNLIHSHGQYDENLVADSDDFMTATKAVDTWVDEKQFYHHDSSTYDEGQVCEHYTQMVWLNSVCLGCTRVQCNNGRYVVSSNYDPPASEVTHMLRQGSDHAPLLVKCSTDSEPVIKPFRFLNF